MIWKPSPKAIQAAVEAYISDKGIKAVLEAAINVDKPIVDLRAIHAGRSRQPAIAEPIAIYEYTPLEKLGLPASTAEEPCTH